VEQRVSVVTLGVADLDRARAFYEALGWASPSTPEEGVVFFPCGGMVLALWSRASLAEDSTVTDPGGWGGVTLAHNVGSPEAGRRGARGGSRRRRHDRPARGGDVLGWVLGVFLDPDGHPWKVAHNPFWQLGPDGAVTI
jgi:catechol 2,3-dioxygenase-like lactoylglutathione lyase family enzyme